MNSDGSGPYPRYLDIASVGSPDGTNGGGNIRFLTNPINLDASAVERMRIASNGYVGMGTSTPGNSLEVYGNNGVKIGSSTINGSPFLKFASNDGAGGVYMDAGEIIATAETINGWGMAFSTKTQDGALSEKLRIAATGAVGIGTTMPQYSLDIYGNNGLRIGSSTASGSPYMLFSSRDGTAGAHMDAGKITSEAESLSGWGLSFSTKDEGASLTEKVRINRIGYVGIGTANPDQLLTVNGAVHSKQINVDMSIFPDYVFKSEYHLPTIREIKTYIDKNGHLPGMPSAAEVEKNGLNLGEMDANLLKKVEELTLYIIEQNKRIEKLETKLNHNK